VKAHDTLEQVEAYSALGWRLFPAGSDKKPRVASWGFYRNRAPTNADLNSWFGNGAPNFPAVILGTPSGGLCCRDFDVADSYHAWCIDQPDLARELPSVETGRGFHVYFRLDTEHFADCGDGELRGDQGHYCLLPPTVHKNGKIYQWISKPTRENLRTFSVSELCSLGLLPCGTQREAERASTQRDTDRMALVSLCVTPDIMELIRRTIPEGPGQRNSCLFYLARQLRGLPGFPDRSELELKPIVEQWHALALPTIATKDFVSTWGDFCHAWNRVKFPVKERYMPSVFERAKATPVGGIDDERLSVLAAMCRELQADAGAEPFYLSVRSAAEPFRVTPRTGAAWLWALVGDGYLTEVKKGGRADCPRKATRWRYAEPVKKGVQ